MKDKCGVYRIWCRPSGKVYVGSSVRIYGRWREHKHRLRREIHPSPHLQRSFTKYGEDAFIFYILEECKKDELEEREQYYLDMLSPSLNSITDIKRRFGKEMRAKIAASLRARAAKITHCPKGHLYDKANTMINQGTRICRKCNAARVKRVYANETVEEREIRYAKTRALYAAHTPEERDAWVVRRKAYYAANRQAVLETNRAYRETNREAIVFQHGAYYESHREAILAQKRTYYREQREKRRLASEA